MTRSDREQKARDALVKAAMRAFNAPFRTNEQMREISALWDKCIELAAIQKEKRRVR